MAYEKGLLRTDSGLFADKGNRAVDPSHPDFAGQHDVSNGVADARDAFADADTFAQTVAAALAPRIGTYAIASAITITSPVHLAKGVVLKPASGVTITISGAFVDPGPVQVFDMSAGGTIAGLIAARPEWFGCDGVDDSDAFQYAATAAPNVFAHGTYQVKGTTTVTSNHTFDLTGASLSGHTDLAAGFMFEASGTSSSAKINIRSTGGEISTNGALGWWKMRGVHDVALRSFDLESDVAVANSRGIHIVNSFNVYIEDFNIHGGTSGGATSDFASGIRIETDAGEGYTVFNNFAIRDGIAQRCTKNIDVVFASASNSFELSNVAMLDSDTPKGTHGLYIEGICENLIITAVKSEKLPTHFEIANTGTTRSSVAIVGWNFLLQNGDVAMKIGSSNSRVTLKRIEGQIDSGTASLFGTMEGQIILEDEPVRKGNGTISNWDGTSGTIQKVYRTRRDRTTGETIVRERENYTYTNEGASAVVTLVLPPAVQNNFRLRFVVAEAFELRVDPNGTDQIIGLTDAAGDRVSSSTVGDTLSLLSSSDGKWYVEGSRGTWSDIN